MRMAGRAAALAALFAAALVSGGCAAERASVTPGPGQPPRVLATTTFLADIAQNVAGNRLVVETLLRPGVDPHEFQPEPQDVIKIAQSQALIVNGLEYETWLTKSMQDGAGRPLVIVATNGLTAPMGASGLIRSGDPHMWMDPLNVVGYANNIRDGLSRADPTGAAAYAASAAAYVSQLQGLDAWIKTRVAQVPPEKRVLVTNHDELGYLADAYGFQVRGAVIPSVTSDAAPSAKQMADLIQTIKSSGAPAIFLDISENQNLASQIASETGAKVVTGLYVETLSAKDGPAPTYIEMMKYDVTTIIEALK